MPFACLRQNLLTTAWFPKLLSRYRLLSNSAAVYADMRPP